MTDFTARQPLPQQPQPQPPPAVHAVRPPYFDFNDIFGRSAGKKPSPSAQQQMTSAASTAAAMVTNGGRATPTPATTNNNNNNNNNNNGSIKQQQQQSSAAAGQQQQQATVGCCPVCGTALRTVHELESHFVWELERLYKQAAAAGRRHRRGTPDKLGADNHHHQLHHHGGGASLVVCGGGGRDGSGRLSPVAGGSRDGSLHGRWETYQKVKANRHNRLRIKNRKRKPDEILLTPTACCCPVCNEPIVAATQEQMNAHVEMCLRNKGHPGTVAVTAVGNDDEDENIDVEGDTETTMYDIVYGGGGVGGGWPQQHRMRQQSMILHAGGGYSRGAVPITGKTTGDGSEDAVLVVDDDGGSGSIYNKYGPNQYAERDIIVPSRPPTACSESRRLTPAEQADQNAMETMDSCENVEPLDVSIKKENTQEDGTPMKPKMDIDKYCGQFNSNGQIVEALKARIRELESVSKAGCDKFTCLLCKGNFKDPVVSTSCWHVYCEVCWLQILGAKKLCPQCYVVTLPSHLRRVYL